MFLSRFRTKMQLAMQTGIGLLCATTIAHAADLSGYDKFSVKAAHRPELIAASIWYPSASKTYRGLIGDNPVFIGEPAYIGAAVEDGKFPLFMVSHGSGGRMETISWIAAGLARQGAIVLGVNHPGSTSGDSSPRNSVKLDERSKDLSAALDTLLKDPTFASHVDTSRIYAVGFSLGGATALNLGGLRFNREAYSEYCRKYGDAMEDCAFLQKGGVDLDHLPDSYSNTKADPRISKVIAVDPGFTYAADPDSFADYKVPTLFINIGTTHLFPAADVSEKGSNLAQELTSATRTVVAPGHHFTFLALCKPQGAALLKEEEDDPVCDDPAGTDRADIHQEILQKIEDFASL